MNLNLNRKHIGAKHDISIKKQIEKKWRRKSSNNKRNNNNLRMKYEKAE